MAARGATPDVAVEDAEVATVKADDAMSTDVKVPTGGATDDAVSADMESPTIIFWARAYCFSGVLLVKKHF